MFEFDLSDLMCDTVTFWQSLMAPDPSGFPIAAPVLRIADVQCSIQPIGGDKSEIAGQYVQQVSHVLYSHTDLSSLGNGDYGVDQAGVVYDVLYAVRAAGRQTNIGTLWTVYLAERRIAS